LTFARLITAVIVVLVTSGYVLPLQTPADPDGEQATISGQVLDGVTGEPIPNVHVALLPRPGSTLTDAEGRFTLGSLAPRTATLTATRVGYSNARLEGRSIPGNDGIPVVLEPGDRIERVLRLYPAARATGRIFGSQGRPAQGINVRPFRWTYNSFGEVEPSYLPAVVTNDLGEFRFTEMDPGEYGFRIYRDELTLTEAAGSLFSPFYYPRTPDRQRAEFVSLESGGETRLNDIVLPTGQGTGVLSVHIVGELGVPLTARHSIRINPAGEYSAARSGIVTEAVAASGNLSYGRYEVEVSSTPEGSQTSSYGMATVDLYGPEVDLTVRVTPNAILQANVIAIGPDGEPQSVSGLVLGFRRPNAFQPNGVPAIGQLTSTAEGAFELRGVRHGVDHRFSLLAIPPDLYPTPIRYRDLDVLRDGLLVRDARELRLDITLGTPAATITGMVTDSAGQPVPHAVVAVLPDDRSHVHMHLTGNADETGRFEIFSVGPGDYRLYAWTEVEGAAWRNAEFMQAYDELGTPVTVEAGESATVDAVVLRR
jgi:hypothetical protein